MSQVLANILPEETLLWKLKKLIIYDTGSS